MNFLHLSTGDTRGAFSGAFRLHTALKIAGHRSKMLVGIKGTSDPDVIGPSSAAAKIRRLLVKMTNQVSKIGFGIRNNNRQVFKFNLSFAPVGAQVKNLGDFRPDLIIVYYTADFISFQQIELIWNQLGRPPIAIYMMDMAALTGSCHYAWECEGYKSACNSCPMATSRLVQLAVRRGSQAKDRLYRRTQPIMIAGSEMLRRQCNVSSLARNLDASKILIGIDPQKFVPMPSVVARKRLGIGHSGRLIYFGAQHVADERKGFAFLVEALSILNTKLTTEQTEEIALLVIGDSNLASATGFRTFNLPYLSDPELFCATYSAADIYVCPSVEDSGPMMINESLMSGTPVVAFERGVALDLIEDSKTGSLAKELSSTSLAEALHRLLLLDSHELEKMRKNCRELAMRKTSTTVQVDSFVALAARATRAGTK